MRELLVVGAAGQMTQVAARAICAAQPALRVCLADLDRAAADRVAHAIGSRQVTTASIDVFDERALRDAVARADFVLHGAGPFYKTADRVMRACIAAGASYMDLSDDVESSLHAIELDAAARAAGVTLYVGHGASPGLSNVLALELMQRLDEVHEVEVAWCVGEEPGVPLGRAVAEHTLHIGAGGYTGFRDGARCTRESFARSTVFPMAEPLGRYRLYECAHPEPVMFGFSHPQLRDVTCWGGLHPQPLNGALRGLSVAVRDHKLSVEDACAFLQAAAPGATRAKRPSAALRRGQARAARFALSGMLRHAAAGYCTLRDLGGVLAAPFRRHPHPAATGVAARVRGLRGGHPCELGAQGVASVPPGSGGLMAAVTGLSEAAFFHLATRTPAPPGVAFPHTWTQPQAFYAELRTLGAASGLSLQTVSS